MKHIITILLFLLCSISSFSQQLFLTKKSNNDFIAKEEVQRILSRPATNSVTPIELDLEQIARQQSITFSIENTDYSLFPIEINVRGINNFTTTYRSADSADYAVLSVYDNDLKGYMFLNASVWSIETIGGNQYALINIDQSAFPDEKEALHERNRGAISNGQNENGNTRMAEMRVYPVISVLVLYTNDAYNNHSDVVNEVFAAEAMANLAFSNSDLNCKLRIVYVGSTNYNELTPYTSVNFDTDLERFATQGDGYMDEVFDLRDKYAADICVLIRNDHPYYCGVAMGINVTEEDAFCMVGYDCASSYLSFAHEIGHLVGCRHDLYVDATMTPYQYGHGYINPDKTWRTVMAYGNGCGSCTRKAYWSNPDVNYAGEPTGDTTYCNNARVWDNRAEYVSYFRTTDDHVTLDSSDVVYANYARLFANHTIHTSGSNVTINPGNRVIFQAGDSICLKPGFHATSGSYFHAYISEYDSAATYYVMIPLAKQGKKNIGNRNCITDDIFDVSVSPNPINENSKLFMNASRDYENVSIDVVNLFGTRLSNIASVTMLTANEYIFDLDANILPQGIMFVVISSNNQLLSTIKISKL